MDKNIVFKNKNGQVIIMAKEYLTYESFIEAFRNRLDKLYIKDGLLAATAVLDISNVVLGPKEILNLFDVLSTHNSFLIKKIMYKRKDKKNIILHEGNIRAGEIKLFSNNTLLVGNINKGSKVIVNGNLYVIGKTSGYVEFKNDKNKLMSASIEDAYIKICSLESKIEGMKENVSISVSGNKIIEEKFMDRRDRLYGKSNCSYIW